MGQTLQTVNGNAVVSALLYVVATVCIVAAWGDASAELYLELGAGHSSSIDTLGPHDVGSRPLGTVELGYQHNGWGVSYLHVSDPTAKDNGLNMIRATKRFGWFK